MHASTIAFVLGAAMTGPAVAGSTYFMQSAAHVEEGCFAPCLCPVFFIDELEGTFTLTPVSSGPAQEIFTVTDVAWTVQGGTTVTGSGLYTRWIHPMTPTQRLELDLVEDDGAARHYDSGVVPVTVDYPALSVAAADNEFWCYNRVFVVVAEPQDRAEDVTGDGQVDTADLVAVIVAWGTADPAADVDDSGQVGVGDLVAVIVGWD